MDNTAATHYCTSCAEFMCVDCHERHGRARATRGHAVSCRPIDGPRMAASASPCRVLPHGTRPQVCWHPQGSFARQPQGSFATRIRCGYLLRSPSICVDERLGRNSLSGAKYSNNNSLSGAKYSNNNSLSGTKYSNNNVLSGAKYSNNNFLSGAKYSNNNFLSGANTPAKVLSLHTVREGMWATCATERGRAPEQSCSDAFHVACLDFSSRFRIAVAKVTPSR